MKRRTKSILEELNSIGNSVDSSYLIENTAVNLIAGVSNLVSLIRETYKDEEIANDLEKRLLNSIRTGDETKFIRGINVARKPTKRQKK